MLCGQRHNLILDRSVRHAPQRPDVEAATVGLRRLLSRAHLTMTRRYCALADADPVEKCRLVSPGDRSLKPGDADERQEAVAVRPLGIYLSRYR
jgi:hypothetical protein